ncbi:MAG: hypothetical protein RMJ51_03640 [Candidatus Calescibacterium sp.]|nr:hypothetical protein [Candidatus Calescibacterium sp.]MCX7971712.1 hypothetical protein [bacterium]MDW8195318.1 hypothetical protein [Candidatus Calescibacterium sp.]
MKNIALPFISICQEFQIILSKDEITKIENIQKLNQLLQKLIQEYLKIREYIYFTLKNEFNNSIIYSKQIDEKILDLDSLLLDFLTSIQVLESNIREIQKTSIPQKDRLLNFQIQLLNQQINKISTSAELLRSIILDIIEILHEFNYEKFENINDNEQGT